MAYRVILILLALASPLRAAEPVAFFGMTLLDGSLQSAELGPDPAEAQRIKTLNQMVTKAFAAGGYRLVDVSPVQETLARTVNPAKCYGCEIRMAEKLGAEFALVGEVLKISNLILTMNLQLREVATGETVKGRVVEIRGNTDASWMRGMRYILKTAFFKREEP